MSNAGVRKHCLHVVLALVLCVGACLLALPSCAGGGNGQGESTPKAETPAPASASQAPAGKSAQDIVDSLSVAQCVEQMLLPAFRTWDDANVTTLNDALSANIAAHNYAGIILFAENFSTTEQSVTLIDAMQKANASNAANLPLVIATDQEGGIVTRTTGTNMPGSMALAATGNVANAQEAAQITAEELVALGVNLNFAPSLDTNSNPANPVIGVRSFSDDPATVASFGTAFVEGLHEGGVVVSVKHFPGHGDTATDSHTGLPLVNKTYDQLKELELVPFSAGISAGADVVMTAHIQFPQMETSTYTNKEGEQVYLPATLSKTILTDILRGDLGFDGVIVTDSMGMGAIQENFDATDAAVLAINAGVDLLLMPVEVKDASSLQGMQAYIDSIVAQVGEGKAIAEETVRAAALRVVQMKLDRGIIADAPDARPLDEKIAQAKAVVGSDEHHAFERQVSDSAVTVVSNDGTLPLRPAAGDHVLLVASYGVKQDALAYGFARLQAEGAIDAGATYEVLAYGGDDVAGTAAVLDAIGRSSFVMCMSQVYGAEDMAAGDTMCGAVDSIVAACNAVGVPIVVMSCGLPYDAARYPTANATLLTYGSKSLVLDGSGQPVGSYGPNIPAGLDVAFGASTQPAGHLPVNVPALDASNNFATEVQFARGFGL